MNVICRYFAAPAGRWKGAAASLVSTVRSMGWTLPVAILFVIGLCPFNAHALTPIARWDVVPYQRIASGAAFNIGVVAFSKGGIDRVEFTVAGQGYKGKNPLQATAMTYNARTDVYEYWVPLVGSDFATNGPFTVQAVVHGKDGGSRTLETLPLVVNATGSLAQSKAWVSPAGNDATGAVNNRSLPFLTVGGASNAIQKANNGSSDGAIVYLDEGTYSVAGLSASTTGEWLTITKSDRALCEKVIINSGQLVTDFLKYDSVTLQSQGSSQYVANDSSSHLWTNNCRRIGSGMDLSDSNPVHLSSFSGHFSTNDYTYNVDYAYRKAALVLNANIVNVGNDVFANTALVVNCTAHNSSNGTHPEWHNDMYQAFTGADMQSIENRIVYNFKATGAHYQGIFLRSSDTVAKNNAFVNVFIEMREPADKNETGGYSFAPFGAWDEWDHLLLWNCTFIAGHSYFSGELTNSSFIGNIFYQFVDNRSPIGDVSLPYAVYNNINNNNFLYNHYMYVYGDGSYCSPNDRFLFNEWPCPHWNAKMPDSHVAVSATSGGNVIDISDVDSADYGAPLDNSVLVNRIPFDTVPSDIYRNPRMFMPDVGAIEKNTGAVGKKNVNMSEIIFILLNEH